MRLPIAQSICEEIGLPTLQGAHRNVHIILCMRFVRMCALGLSPLMALSFTQLGFTDIEIGLFMTLTMGGILILGSTLAYNADNFGRRKVLFGGCILTFASGALLTTSTSYWIILLCVIFGRLTPGADDTGPFRAVEESILAHHVPRKFRTEIYAWYTIAGTLGAVCGSLFCGWTFQYLRHLGFDGMEVLRCLYAAYGLLGLFKAGLVFLLSEECELAGLSRAQTNEEHLSSLYGDLDAHDEHRTLLETDEEAQSESAGAGSTAPRQRLGRTQDLAEMEHPATSLLSSFSQRSKETLMKLSIIASLDSFGSGLVLTPMLTLYAVRKYKIHEEELLRAIAIVRILSAISSIVTPSIARRIGAVKAIVLTHLPSALLTALIPVPTTWTITMIVIMAAMSLASTDQALRSALVSTAFSPEHTTAAIGAISVVRTATYTVGPIITGMLASSNHFGVAFLLAGCVRAGHDLGLVMTFWNSEEFEFAEDSEACPDGIALSRQGARSANEF